MEFKKHFSSNLQNLSVKKTLILNPPPNIIHHHYNHSQIKQQSISKHQSPYQSRYSYNKQNKANNQPYNENYANNSKNSRKLLQQNHSRDNTPILTFNKIKRNAIQMMENGGRIAEEHNRKLFKSIQNNGLNSKNILVKQDHSHTDSSKRLQSFTANGQNNKSIRLGSMVFGNLIKKDTNNNKSKSPIRESRSFDRLANLQTQRSEAQSIECMNNDGQHAKYKVVKHDCGQQQKQFLYYCFNCAIYLVKQGFSIEELTLQDRRQYTMRSSNYMSKSDFYKEDIQSSRYSLSKPVVQNEKIKIGQQVKCKIIMKLNKIKVNREEFNKIIESHLENIDYFYHSLTNYIEQQRISDRQEIIRIKNIKKGQPENYQNQLSSSLGTIDYMMKNLQGVNYDFLREVQDLLEKDVSYPRMKINLQPLEGFQKRIDKFAQFFQNHLKICLEDEVESIFKNKQLPNGQQLQQQLFHHKTNPLRFSFEQALKKSSKKMSLNEMSMNPLYEQNESQLDESMPVVQRRQNAFRNLFPQENDQYEEYSIEKVKQSPMFKQF